jgi:hypothetical protein
LLEPSGRRFASSLKTRFHPLRDGVHCSEIDCARRLDRERDLRVVPRRNEHRRPFRAAFQATLSAADPVSLLLEAEAGARSFGGFNGACNAIAIFLGYPLVLNNSYSEIFCSMIGTRLAGLRYLTNGPSLQYPQGNFYNYVF